MPCHAVPSHHVQSIPIHPVSSHPILCRAMPSQAIQSQPVPFCPTPQVPSPRGPCRVPARRSQSVMSVPCGARTSGTSPSMPTHRASARTASTSPLTSDAPVATPAQGGQGWALPMDVGSVVPLWLGQGHAHSPLTSCHGHLSRGGGILIHPGPLLPPGPFQYLRAEGRCSSDLRDTAPWAAAFQSQGPVWGAPGWPQQRTVPVPLSAADGVHVRLGTRWWLGTSGHWDQPHRHLHHPFPC